MVCGGAGFKRNDWTSPAYVTREKSVVILIEKYKVKTNFKKCNVHG